MDHGELTSGFSPTAPSVFLDIRSNNILDNHAGMA